MEQTGRYDGITELQLRNEDPLKFETLHTKLRAYCVSAREMARRIPASPGVRRSARWSSRSIRRRAMRSRCPTASWCMSTR